MKRRDFLKTSVVASVALSLNFEGFTGCSLPRIQ